MAGNAGELYLEIRVDDKGSVKVKNLGKDLKKTGKDGEEAFDRVDRKSRRLEGSLGNLGGTIGRLAAAWGAWETLRAGWNVSMDAARYETLEVVLNRVGENFGYSAGQLDNYTRALQDGGIAMTESREVLLKMIQAQMDLGETTKLARIAQDAAVIGNLNSSQSFEQLVFGIQSTQVEVLRTIGINVNFEQSYKKAAKAMGKTTAALTEQEKVQIRTNAVLEAGTGIAGAYESAMTTAGKKVSSFTRYVDNFKVTMGEAFQPATIEAVDKATEAMKRLTKEVGRPENQERLAGLAVTAVETAENLGKIGAKALVFAGDVADGWNDLPEPIQQLGLLGAVILGPKGFAILAAISWAMDKAKENLNDEEFQARLRVNAPGFEGLVQQAKETQAELDRIAAENRGDVAYTFRGEVTPPSSDINDSIDSELDRFFGSIDDYVAPIEAPTAKVVNAIESITAKLAVMNDTGTEGEARIAKLTKEYNKFASVLGSGNAQVKEYADVIGYANEHYGRTPAEVAKSTMAIRENISALEGEVAAIDTATDIFGRVNDQRLDMLKARADAERKYHEAVLDGVDPIIAARRRDLEVQLAQRKATRKNLEVLTDFSKEYLKLVQGETAFRMSQIEEQARVYREAGADAVAVAQWEAEAKLRVSREWQDGAIRALRDYADSATDFASQVEDVTTSAFQGMEDALVEFVKTGKLEFSALADSIITDMLRIAVQQSITGPLAEGFGGFITGLFNARGGAYASSSLARYEGRVMDRPTVFAFEHGGSVGVLGEAGRKEVIAPLFRDPVTNDMGVRVHGAMGGGLNQFNFYANFEMPTPSGNSEQDSAYLENASKQLEKQMRGWFADEMRNAQRPGGQLNQGAVL